MNPQNVSQDEYLEVAKKYVDDMQAAIQDKQYEITLDINFLFGKDSDMANMLNGESNAYWAQILTNAQELGNELVENIAKGYQNGWDEQSMTMVAESLNKMSEIQAKIQKAQAESQMELLTADFKMSDMSQESFELYLEKLQEQGEAITEAAKTASANAMAAQKLMLEDGAIDYDTYTANIESINKAYEQKAAESANAVLNEGMKAIKEVFGDEFNGVAEQLNAEISNITIEPDDLQASMENIQRAIESSISNAGISSGVKKSIGGYLEKLMPTADELKKLATSDQSLWKVYGETLTSVEALKTLSGSGNQMGNAVISAVNSRGNLYNAEKAGKDLKAAIVKPFNEKISITVPVEVKYMEKTVSTVHGKVPLRNGEVDETLGGAAIKVYDLSPYTGDKVKKSNATGTTYFGGGLTYINEHGSEIIDLPQGSRIYPSDKSEKMMRQPNINVNVTVAGNIYGSEQAADEIGSVVCSRIMECINAV
ncbi:MAG: hypothetical protein J6A07_01530 [Firmicutes bacterium]|nr:hypothetical protein [Bacillota bacterium]